MFKGTRARGKGEFARLVEQSGGQDNAFTSQDVTAYYVDIAADRVDLVLRPRGRPHAEPPPRSEGDRRRARSGDGGAAHPDRGRPRGRAVRGAVGDRVQGAPVPVADHRLDGGYPPRSAPPSSGPSTTRTTSRTTRCSWPWATSTRPRCSSGSAPSSAAFRAAPRRPPVTAVEPAQSSDRRVSLRRASARLPSVSLAYHVPNHRRPTRPRSSCSPPSCPRAGPRASTGRSSTSSGRPDAGGDYRYFARATRTSSGSTPAPARAGARADRAALLREIERSRRSRCRTRSWRAPRTRSRPRSSGPRTRSTRGRPTSPASS